MQALSGRPLNIAELTNVGLKLAGHPEATNASGRFPPRNVLCTNVGRGNFVTNTSV